ncbi:MAG: thermonuclease family protein, partial [Pseudomonadota bacterium]
RLLLLFLLVAASAAYLGGLATEEISGRAVAVDGDSLRIDGRDIRLRGIDAPEFGQVCQDAQGADYNCGDRARRALSRLIGQGTIRCESAQLDRFGRTLALCFAGGEGPSINEMMVRQGWAVDYGDFPGVEQNARNDKRGLWAGRFETPRAFRANRGDAVGSTWLSGLFRLGGDDE